MTALRRTLSFLSVPLALLITLAWATAGEDPALLAKKTLSDLESKRAAPALSGSASAARALDAAAHPLAEARRMLARAAELRGLGDVARAEIAEDVALEWALTAREIVRAVELEQDSAEQAAAETSASSRAARARALLDDAIARRTKLQNELDSLEKEAAARALDAGPAPSGKPPKKGSP